jgi:HAD superfamily hydrolase (TIGR01662 family)
MIKAVVFDFDGTLVDSTESIFQEYRRVVKIMRLREISYEEFRRELGKPWDRVLETLWPGVDVKKFSEVYRQEKEKTGLLSHVREALGELRRRYRLAVLTSRGEKSLYRILKESGIEGDTFEVVLHKDVSPAHKPDPEALRHLMRVMKLKPKEVVYVGDAIVDAECAKAAGVAFVGVLTGGATREELKKLRVKHIISSMKELPPLVCSTLPSCRRGPRRRRI